jgi:alcohol dehydrogenase (NADP+)
MPSQDKLSEARIPLITGDAVPVVGFGTLIPDATAAASAIKTAIEAGYRLLDCAELYGNEDVVGRVIREALEAGTVCRKDIFVTTKLWNNNHRPERVGPALEASLRLLQLDHVDCYLIHTPFAFAPGDERHPRDAHDRPLYDSEVTLLETWQAMESRVAEGKCMSIGLSDISLDRLKEIVTAARIKPALVQIESHPYLPEWEVLDFCRRHGIVMQAFAPLGHGMEPRVTEDPIIAAIARRVNKTPAQVALAWAVQRGTAVLTTSVTPHRIRENFDISPLPDEAMEEIRDGIATSIRFNAVVETGIPGFVPRLNKKGPTGGPTTIET